MESREIGQVSRAYEEKMMELREGLIAVVTGGGTGMGRELVRQLAEIGCDVATCDVFADAVEETRSLALSDAPSGTRVSTFVCDVSDESQVLAFRDAVATDLATEHINLLFNNAGIGGGGSFLTDDRAEWERTFGVDWCGVYYCTRAFMPMLLVAEVGHVVNTSSINGLWASIGPTMPHTAYCTSKFAVRGFTEALITDFRVNAPHLRASVVMPGHIGTSIVINSGKVHGQEPETMGPDRLLRLRSQIAASGLPLDGVSDDDLRKGIQMMAENFRDSAPTTAAQAATIILDGVRQNRWRILVGEDAEILDGEVRRDPEHAYDPEFWEGLRERGLFGLMG
jgi:NAD(P)-dependent dehydrogenase (short-subunit alcohol dehydrogenase family)